MPSLSESEARRQAFLRTCQPGARSRYNGVVQPARGGEEIRVVPTLCGRCFGHGRVGDELFCPVCQGARYVDPQSAYEPYYADEASSIHRAALPANRSYAERAQHPAHRTTNATGVSVRSAGRRGK